MRVLAALATAVNLSSKIRSMHPTRKHTQTNKLTSQRIASKIQRSHRLEVAALEQIKNRADIAKQVILWQYNTIEAATKSSADHAEPGAIRVVRAPTSVRDPARTGSCHVELHQRLATF